MSLKIRRQLQKSKQNRHECYFIGWNLRTKKLATRNRMRVKFLKQLMSLRNLIKQTIDGKYQIEREIGKGGMGTVYLATHIGTERPVAVKIIAPQFMQRAEFVERFRREARAAGRLRHPNVVDVTDFGFSETKDGKVAYLVMEYLDGCTLGEILEEEKQLPLAWSLDILEQVCSAVDEAHKQGIIHRDLKPDNIWLEPNQRGGYTVKVLDFGIAKLEEQHHEIDARAVSSNDSTIEIYRKETLVEDPQNPTMTGNADSTRIFEKQTLIQNENTGTSVSGGENSTRILQQDAGTLIQNPTEIDSEGGTAILPKSPATGIENDGTKILSVPEIASQITATNANLTRVGAVLGTPLYMSPEQCRGQKLDPRSDVYSLGVIAYQMLGGKTPFEGEFTSVMKAHQESEPPILEVKKTPKKVKRTIFAALAKDPENRPQSAEAFASELRSHSDGFGRLVQRALVIYSEHLPIFLSLAFLATIPHLLSFLLQLTFGILASTEVIDISTPTYVQGVVSFVGFFAQTFTTGMLIGTVTWLVAQILAVPLRPISMKPALRAAWSKWKSLFFAVTPQTLLTFVTIACCFPLGFYVSTIYSLVSPTIMMENVTGRAAFRRSKELVKRSFWTALATCILIYFVPILIGGTVGGVTVLAIKQLDFYEQMKDVEAAEEEKNKNGKNVNVAFGPDGVKVTEKESDSDDSSPEEKYAQRLKSVRRETITQGIINLILTPILLLISSLTSVIIALLYFKTRQAGGESMADLLEQFEESERPRSKWQMRVRDRLEQSGRVTSKT